MQFFLLPLRTSHFREGKITYSFGFEKSWTWILSSWQTISRTFEKEAWIPRNSDFEGTVFRAQLLLVSLELSMAPVVRTKPYLLFSYPALLQLGMWTQLGHLCGLRPYKVGWWRSVQEPPQECSLQHLIFFNNMFWGYIFETSSAVDDGCWMCRHHWMISNNFLCVHD